MVVEDLTLYFGLDTLSPKMIFMDGSLVLLKSML